MAKILISWVAYKNDFIENENGAGFRINKSGPHSDLYQTITINSTYQRHILLCQETDNKEDRSKYKAIVDDLRLEMENVELKEISINDVIDVGEIYQKCEEFLVDHINDEVDIFISPGTPAMQTVWYLLASGFKNVKLFQIRAKRFRKDEISPIEFMDVIATSAPRALAIIESSKNKLLPKNAFETESLKKTYKLAQKVILTNKSTVLIYGETGTGKEVLARHIHNKSRRSEKPFIPINCAALGDDLLESRLFGYVKGAYTNATETTTGTFENAQGGTVFLDEIGDISPKLQQTLLRVLQEREITKLGSSDVVKVDVRIIAATHRDLLQLVEEGKFRSDLYFRLAIIELHLPSLKMYTITERETLLDSFIERKSNELGLNKIKLDHKVRSCLLNYSFSGNFRELENLIERFYIIGDGVITLKDVPDRILYPEGSSASQRLIDVENRHIKKVLASVGGNINRAKTILAVSYNTLVKRIEKFNLLKTSNEYEC